MFRVTNESLLYSEEGLIAAMGVLDLSVAPHAAPPARRPRPKWGEFYGSDLIDITNVLVAANAPVFRTTRARRRVDSPDGPTNVAAELIALGRMQATARTLEYRFGLDAALAAVSGASVGTKLGIGEAAAEIGVRIPFEVTPPLPAPPTDTQTSLELPWRLQISPNGHGAFAHSPVAVEHNGRFELWHTRLGVRAHDKDGNPTVDELSADQRTVRAIWARDFDVLAGFGFTSPPRATTSPRRTAPRTSRRTRRSGSRSTAATG